MDVREYFQRRTATVGPLLRALALLLGLVSGKALSDAQRRDLAIAIAEAVNTARGSVAEAAFQMYLGLRPESAGDFGPAPRLNDVPALYFAKVLDTYRESLESEDNAPAAATRISQAATGMVDNAGREMVQAATRVDPAAVAWARVLTGAESCGFCAMLASRGPEYRSKESAGFNNAFHPGCDCIVVPVFRGHETEWPGYAEFQRLERLWVDVTRNKRGKAALAAFKNHFATEDVTSLSPVRS